MHTTPLSFGASALDLHPEARLGRLLAHFARHGFTPSEVFRDAREHLTPSAAAALSVLASESAGPRELFMRHPDYSGRYLVFIDTRAARSADLVTDFVCRGSEQDKARMRECLEGWSAIEESRPLDAHEAVRAGAEVDLARLVHRELTESERRTTSVENVVASLRALSRLEAKLQAGPEAAGVDLPPAFPPTKWIFTPEADALALGSRPASNLVNFYSRDGHEVVVMTREEQVAFERAQGIELPRNRRIDVPTFAALIAFASVKREPVDCVYVTPQEDDSLPLPSPVSASSRGPRV